MSFFTAVLTVKCYIYKCNASVLYASVCVQRVLNQYSLIPCMHLQQNDVTQIYNVMIAQHKWGVCSVLSCTMLMVYAGVRD